MSIVALVVSMGGLHPQVIMSIQLLKHPTKQSIQNAQVIILINRWGLVLVFLKSDRFFVLTNKHIKEEQQMPKRNKEEKEELDLS